MTKEEIEKAKLKEAEDENEKSDLILEEDAIAVMVESEGWRVMMKKANKLIVELLEPIDAGAVTTNANLELIGANTIANAKTLEVFREFINYAESVKKARRVKAELGKQKE